MPLLRGPINARPPAGAAPRSGGRRRKRAGLELLLRNPLFFLIFAVRVSQKFCRATGSTTYRVRVVFPDGGGETMEEKILRMIRNEGLVPAGNCGMMGIPQMSRQSERSA